MRIGSALLTRYIFVAEGGFDILVNNAGIAVLRPIEELAPADFTLQLQVNPTSVYLGTRRVVAAMRASGIGGSIVNMSSVAGLVGVPSVSAYAATKAGIRLFGKSVAMETAREGIRINSVHPGMILMGMQKIAIGQSWRRAWTEVVPFYAFPGDVRRILYTTNAIEALNAKLRRAVRARGHFPTDEAAMKLLYLVLNRSEKEWRTGPREWTMAKASSPSSSASASPRPWPADVQPPAHTRKSRQSPAAAACDDGRRR